jgi:flavin reductase (DIM6/NTAB) family NADH-FMN oxidoreductase RutF
MSSIARNSVRYLPGVTYAFPVDVAALWLNVCLRLSRSSRPPYVRVMSTQNLTSGTPQFWMNKEKAVKRNPHPAFKEVEKSRKPWDQSLSFNVKQTINPNWKYGDGANDGGASLKIPHIEIDPYEEGRPAVANYKLLISAIIPRPIGFLSTRSADGSSTNLAPFSYFQMINHDPPLFIIGYSGGFENSKDSLKNLVESKECVINIISEHFVEAANSTSVNAPYGESEWSLSGLTPAPCSTVKASRVKEAIFSVEGILDSTKEFESRATPGKKTGVLAIIEGTRFWVREDAINKERNLIDPEVRHTCHSKN